MKGGITVAGAALAARGALSLLEAFRLKDDWLGAKLMPAVGGVVLTLLGAAPAERAPWPESTGARHVLLMLAVLAAYIGLLPVLGFRPATVHSIRSGPSGTGSKRRTVRQGTRRPNDS